MQRGWRRGAVEYKDVTSHGRDLAVGEVKSCWYGIQPVLRNVYGVDGGLYRTEDSCMSTGQFGGHERTKDVSWVCI